jgi:hypothetical protein
LPAPERVLYQLGAHADDPGFASGEDLVAKLETATGEILEASGAAAKTSP